MYYIELAAGQEIRKLNVNSTIKQCKQLIKNNVDFKLSVKSNLIKGYILECQAAQIEFVNEKYQIHSYYNQDIKQLKEVFK